jgi:regulator of protease activity HflC (stomatin/prohibitin superfamily)
MAPAVDPELMFTVFGFLIAVILALKSMVIVRPYEKGVVERLGKYNRTLGSGMNIIIPFVESVYKIDMREALIDVPSQEVITKDNVNISVDAVIYFKVTDPFRVMYNVAMFEDAVSKLAQTNLRNIIGELGLDETLASRDRINMELRRILDEITDKWGVRVTRVEIQDISPPKDIVDAMSRQMKAERTKRAAILDAEGVKQAEILRAEGAKQSEILDAEGKAAAIERVAEAERRRKALIAEGEAKAINRVFGAIHEGRATKDIITIKYLEALEKMADGQATKIFMPFETSGVLSGAAAIGEMFKEGSRDVVKRVKGGVKKIAGKEEKTSLEEAGSEE